MVPTHNENVVNHGGEIPKISLPHGGVYEWYRKKVVNQ